MKEKAPTKKELKFFMKLDRIDVVKGGSIGYVSLWRTFQEHPELFCGIEAEYLSKETDPHEFHYCHELERFYKKAKWLWDPLR